jgi:hypothetical protein
MLKFEKLSRNEIGVRLYKRERIFSPLFLKALAIALALHLVGLFCFQIKAFKISNQTPHAPVSVAADAASGNLALLESLNPRMRYRLEPRSSLPQLPEPPPLNLLGKIEYSNEQHLQLSSPFAELEEALTRPAPRLFPKTSTPAIEISTAGALAGLKFLEDGSAVVQQLAITVQSVAKYAIQVEGKTGQVIWQEKLQSTSEAALDKLAEQILATMRFQKEEGSFITKGDIEIRFTP